MASVNFQLALVAASHGAASCWRIQSAGGVLSADTAGLDRSRRGGASETLLSSHSTLCLSGLGPVPDCVTATVGGSQCWLLAVVYCGGYFDFVVFTLAVTGSLVAEEAHSQCSACPASDYVSAPVVFYRKAVMAGTHSEFGGGALGLSGDRAQYVARLSVAAYLGTGSGGNMAAI